MPERSSDLPRVTQLSDGVGMGKTPDSLFLVQCVLHRGKVQPSTVKPCENHITYLRSWKLDYCKPLSGSDSRILCCVVVLRNNGSFKIYILALTFWKEALISLPADTFSWECQWLEEGYHLPSLLQFLLTSHSEPWMYMWPVPPSVLDGQMRIQERLFLWIPWPKNVSWSKMGWFPDSWDVIYYKTLVSLERNTGFVYLLLLT